MSKELYRRLSKAERKLENTNRLRTNNSTLRIKYEGVKKLLEKKDEEIERLNNIINELNNAYCKVITKCEEMIDNRFYMNDIAIKKYADEIKDICKYYVGEAKELKGEDKE